jgi:hypothetical protein
MKRVLIYSPNPLDGVSYYRQWGPMSALHSEVQCVQFPNVLEELTHWTWYLNYDLCLFSRPHRKMDFVFMDQCKKFGLPVWIDYDDDLLNITPDNPVYETFASEEARAVIIDCLAQADVISTPSPLLYSEFKKQYKNVVFIENALDDRLLKFGKSFSSRDKFSWRGSPSHLMDLFQFKEAISEPLSRIENGEMLFFGINPYMIRRSKGVQFSYHKCINLIDYIRNFCEFNAGIQIVPLADTRFNQVKSNLAWLDATLAGSVCLAPDGSSWCQPGQMNYALGQPDDFAYRFGQLLGKSENDLNKMWQTSMKFIKENLMLSTLNKKRLEIINNL